MTIEIPLVRRLEAAHRQAALASPGEAMMVGQAGRMEGLYFIKSTPDSIELRQLYFPDAAPGPMDPMFTVFGIDRSKSVAVTCLDILQSCGFLPSEADTHATGIEPTSSMSDLKKPFEPEGMNVLTRNHDLQDRHEYTATLKNQEYLWIKVGDVDVCIKQEDEGIVVDLYANKGTSTPLASAWAHQSDVEADQEEAMTPDGEE